jgi:hypothetical protein
VNLEAGRAAARQVRPGPLRGSDLEVRGCGERSGRKATEQLEHDLEETQHLRRSIESAVEKAEAALVAPVEKERAGILRDLDKKISKAQRAYGEEAEALLAIGREQDQLQGLRLQVVRFPEPVKNSTVERPFPNKEPFNGQPLSYAKFERYPLVPLG